MCVFKNQIKLCVLGVGERSGNMSRRLVWVVPAEHRKMSAFGHRGMNSPHTH